MSCNSLKRLKSVLDSSDDEDVGQVQMNVQKINEAEKSNNHHSSINMSTVADVNDVLHSSSSSSDDENMASSTAEVLRKLSSSYT